MGARGLMRRWRLLLAVAILVLTWELSAFAHCYFGEDQANNYHVDQRYGAGPWICFAHGPVSAIGRLWVFISRHVEAVFAGVTASATFAIAYFTATLWRATSEQAQATRQSLRVTRQQLRLARQEFISTHRPRIIVRGFRVVPDSDGTVRTIAFLYVNSGSSNARIMEIGTHLSIGSIPSGLSFEKHRIYEVTLPSGDRETFSAEYDALHFARLTEQIRPAAPAHRIYFAGYVRYADGLDRERETGFCRMLDVGTNRWITVQDSEYEYED